MPPKKTSVGQQMRLSQRYHRRDYYSLQKLILRCQLQHNMMILDRDLQLFAKTIKKLEAEQNIHEQDEL